MNSYITAGVLLALCVGLSFSVYDRYVIEQEVSSRLSEREAEREEIVSRKNSLEEKVKYLSGESGVEAEIRKHFDVAKAGEQVVVLVESDRDKQATSSKNSAEPSRSFWSWLLSW